MTHLLYQPVRTFSMMNLLFQGNAYCRSSSVSMDIAIVAYFGLLPTPTHVSIVCLTSQLTLLSAHPRPSRFRPDKMMKIPQNVACNLCTITTPTRLTDQVSLCTATTTVWWLLSTSDELFCSTSSLTDPRSASFSDAGGYTDDDFHE